MPAVIVGEKPQAFAGAIVALADANVVEVAEPESVNGEAPAADFAGDFPERIELRFRAFEDAKVADAAVVGGSHEGERSQGSCVGHAGIILLASGTGIPPRPIRRNRSS